MWMIFELNILLIWMYVFLYVYGIYMCVSHVGISHFLRGDLLETET